MICKFCGKELNDKERYLRRESDDGSCVECTSYCMKICEKASSIKGWNFEPCISCNHNPYKLQHTWNGRKWIQNEV